MNALINCMLAFTNCTL